MGCFKPKGGTGDDHEEEKAKRQINKRIEEELKKEKQVYRATHRLLLLGMYK
jgi:guanine nucleotide-binding protein G(s) subunit alpha